MCHLFTYDGMIAGTPLMFTCCGPTRCVYGNNYTVFKGYWQDCVRERKLLAQHSCILVPCILFQWELPNIATTVNFVISDGYLWTSFSLLQFQGQSSHGCTYKTTPTALNPLHTEVIWMLINVTLLTICAKFFMLLRESNTTNGGFHLNPAYLQCTEVPILLLSLVSLSDWRKCVTFWDSAPDLAGGAYRPLAVILLLPIHSWYQPDHFSSASYRTVEGAVCTTWGHQDHGVKV